MITKSTVLFFLAIVLTSNSFAEPAKLSQSSEHNPTSADSVRISVVFGHKTSTFVIKKTEAGGLVTFESTTQRQQAVPLEKRDIEFIMKKVEAIDGPSHSVMSCDRQYMGIARGSKEMLVCLRSKSKLTESALSLLDTLSNIH